MSTYREMSIDVMNAQAEIERMVEEFELALQADRVKYMGDQNAPSIATNTQPPTTAPIPSTMVPTGIGGDFQEP
jgi:hypothetical protein